MTMHPMISARVLGAMPHFIKAEAGTAGLLRACQVAGLPIGVEQDERQFITQRSLMSFIDVAARLIGDDQLGLVLAPHLTPLDYGTWGRYLLSAPTLSDALQRARQSLRWHSTRDKVSVCEAEGIVRFAYRFGSAGQPLYENVAYCAAGVLVNLVRGYLGPGWNPVRVELDLPGRRPTERASHTFGCEVQPGCGEVAVLIPTQHLASPPVRPVSGPAVTLADVRRSRLNGAPSDLPGIVRELVRLQLLGSSIDLESTAARLRTGPRTLQRQLDRHGLQFRDIANRVRTQRARELLAEADLSVTAIASDLGYSAPTHFSRAFQRETGMTPRAFRQRLAQQETVPAGVP